MLNSMTENILNHVDLQKTSATIESGVKDRSTLRRPVKLHGDWILDPSTPFQFRSEMSFEKGNQVVEIDSPSFLGGNGNRLGPMAYCVAGITSCFISTFASVAAMHGIKLTKLSVNTECKINFSKTFDISEDPITEGIAFDIEARAENADKGRLEEILRMAEERCPAVYSMTHLIQVSARIK